MHQNLVGIIIGNERDNQISRTTLQRATLLMNSSYEAAFPTEHLESHPMRQMILLQRLAFYLLHADSRMLINKMPRKTKQTTSTLISDYACTRTRVLGKLCTISTCSFSGAQTKRLWQHRALACLSPDFKALAKMMVLEKSLPLNMWQTAGGGCGSVVNLFADISLREHTSFWSAGPALALCCIPSSMLLSSFPLQLKLEIELQII